MTSIFQVYIDGPFGAPTSQIFRAQHAVLIGTGIGVTPFASILQSIMHRYWQARNICPKCTYSWTENLNSSVLNLRKVIINERNIIVVYLDKRTGALLAVRWFKSSFSAVKHLFSYKQRKNEVETSKDVQTFIQHGFY